MRTSTHLLHISTLIEILQHFLSTVLPKDLELVLIIPWRHSNRPGEIWKVHSRILQLLMTNSKPR